MDILTNYTQIWMKPSIREVFGAAITYSEFTNVSNMTALKWQEIGVSANYERISMKVGFGGFSGRGKRICLHYRPRILKPIQNNYLRWRETGILKIVPNSLKMNTSSAEFLSLSYFFQSKIPDSEVNELTAVFSFLVFFRAYLVFLIFIFTFWRRETSDSSKSHILTKCIGLLLVKC